MFSIWGSIRERFSWSTGIMTCRWFQLEAFCAWGGMTQDWGSKILEWLTTRYLLYGHQDTFRDCGYLLTSGSISLGGLMSIECVVRECVYLWEQDSESKTKNFREKQKRIGFSVNVKNCPSKVFVVLLQTGLDWKILLQWVWFLLQCFIAYLNKVMGLFGFLDLSNFSEI